MQEQVYQALCDEIVKIGESLIVPAVGDHSLQGGPPATPFERKKGFKKLQVNAMAKEAGLGKDVYRLSLKAAARTRRAARRVGAKYDDLGRRTYSKLPDPVKNNFEKLHDLAEPSDMKAGAALQVLKKSVGL